MNPQSEKNAICNELQSIINELNEIANGVQSDFKGIGNEQCARSIRNVSDKCRTARRKLQNINMNRLENSGGGSFGGGGGGTRF